MTTLCYLERDGAYLMLHRTKKENDMNKDKWLGLGGHFEDRESPEECIIREVYEESGLKLEEPVLRGIITFVNDRYPTEYIFLYTATKFSGTLRDCDEGELTWVPKKEICNLPIWEGDQVFFSLLETTDAVFSLKLTYEGEALRKTELNGKEILNKSVDNDN
ncbi:MAG: 8-oxo-dGTP diphosphatase [Lachnospiraceae bacterium]|nr:8-oxo-dGTP diphosphatase [Lachnospiraceae bacterium]